MLKIYLDWNVITHCKKGDRYEDILNKVELYGDKFIFPYSNAHIRDLQVKPQTDKAYYNMDVEILTSICRDHLLNLDGNKILPLFCLPENYLKELGSTIQVVQNAELLSPSLYVELKKQIKSSISDDIYKSIQGAKPQEVIDIIDKYIRTQTTFKGLENLMTSCLPQIGKLINVEAQFKCICLGLDLFGYRPENKCKVITNIDTDASHLFYASNCDYFVTADRKLRDKAIAMYSYYRIQTKVISPEDLLVLLKDSEKQYVSFDYAESCIEKYGTPRIENDGAHYTIMSSPVFGLFNVCHKLDSYWGYNGRIKSGLFRYCFQNTPYLYYDEIESFLNLFEGFISDENKESFRHNYVSPILSRDISITDKAKFDLEILDKGIHITLLSDPFTPVPCPMMQMIISQ